MKKTFLMTLIALSISGMSCAQSDRENTAKKQETVQQEFVKERREQAKMAKNLIEQKVLKDAKKQAKPPVSSGLPRPHGHVSGLACVPFLHWCCCLKNVR